MGLATSLDPRALRVDRTPGEFSGDPRRVILRPFQPGSPARTAEIVRQVLDLSEEEALQLLEGVREQYGYRHRNLEQALDRCFSARLAPFVPDGAQLPRERRLLIGSYFTMEYSIESAALFNPSIVAHPNQGDLVKEGSLRVIMSFRAIGEGHLSSIAFRSGIVHADGSITFDPASRYIETPELRTDAAYDKHLFELKLNEMGACNELTTAILGRLPDEFTFVELEDSMANSADGSWVPEEVESRTLETMEWLARSNYEIEFQADRRISERVIFPVSENERHGIEDARFVRFVDDDDTVTYYATYTAYNGEQILPQLIETSNFLRFNAITLNGEAVQNKGMALFPRKIDGKYFMISRQDGVNLHIMSSDHLHFWHESQILRRPENPWECVQIGNCGSPIETEAGWLLLTHGVGPMRRYSLGVDLLDLQDPTKVLGHLNEPLLSPNEHERDGYVPNVLYTCGCLVHREQLIIPYGMSDTRCAIAGLAVSELLERLLRRAG